VLVNPRITGGQFRFSFDTTPSRAYTVEYSDAVRPTNWQALTNFSGSSGPWTFSEPVASQKRFYRVSVQ
jgi:hypothetical protein